MVQANILLSVLYLTEENYGQVQAAISALKYYRELPKLPADFPIPATRDPDMMDFLQYIFGFQVSAPDHTSP